MYSEIIKRAFLMLKKSDSYIGMDNSTRKILNVLEHIDNGLYLRDIENGFQRFNVDTWFKEHKSEGMLGSSHGVLLPIDKDLRLLVLLRIFHKIQESSFEDYINEFYSEDLLSTSMDLVILLSGVYKGLKGDPKLNLKNIESHRKKEIRNINRFNKEVSSEFERLLLDDLEIKYPKDKTKIIMGDNFENITNSTIVNKSNLLTVMDKVDDDMTQLLIKLKKMVEQSNNEDAIGLFNDLLEELSQKKPQKRKLKSFWHELVNLLPHINHITDIASNINSLWED